MMKPILQMSGLVAMSLALGGCQSLGFPGWSFKSHRAAPVPRQAVADNDAILEEGKAQLRAGSLSAAAASFRMASADPATAAEANNGLAIVYAKIGRSDLADRYFRAALALEPEEQRFASNLLRLQRQVLLDRQAASARLAAISEPAPPPSFVPARPNRDRGVEVGRIERVARGVVRIRTPGELGGAPRIQIAYRERPAVTEPPPQGPAGKVDEQPLTAAVDKSRTYPLRVVFEP